MSAGDRFKSWIEGLSVDWGDKLRGWFTRFISDSGTKFLEDSEPLTQDMMRETLTRIKDIPSMPPDIKTAIEDALTKADWQKTLSGWIWYLVGIIPSILSSGQPFANLVNYDVEYLQRTSRLDPLSVITAWRRDPATYNKYFNDLKELGWSDDRIETMKFATLFYPNYQELIHWLAKEVFEEDMVERYGLDDEKPIGRLADFEKAGVSEEQMTNAWRAHWEHASFIQVIEMLHRGLLSLDKDVSEPPTTKEGWVQRDAEGEKALFEWYRVVEIPPYWRDRLTGIAWNVLTRVDTRRMWDMRSITEERLYSIYHQQGYHGEDLDDMVKWTKIFTDFPVKMAHFTNGWINEDDIRAWLASLDIPPDRIEDFIREKTRPASAERVAGDKNLTMALIVEGVKKGVISEAEGIELLIDLGYSSDEADYIIRVRVETATGSPENMEQFRDITQKYRKAVGIPSKPVSEALKNAGAEVVRVTKEVEDLRRLAKQERDKLADDEILPKEATARFDEVTLALHRAEAELFRVTTDYNALRAEWHQQEAK